MSELGAQARGNGERSLVEVKVGIFAVAIILILAWATVRVSEKTSVSGYGGYDLTAVFDNATGLKMKAPVELAGVKVGEAQRRASDSRRAKVLLLMDKAVKLPDDSQAVLRTRGFPRRHACRNNTWLAGGPSSFKRFRNRIYRANRGYKFLVGQFSSIATDIKQMTSSFKTMIGDNCGLSYQQDSLQSGGIHQVDVHIPVQNQQNIDRVAMNLQEMTDQLEIVAKGRVDVEESMENIASITRKIDEGEDYRKVLVNDDEIKINSTRLSTISMKLLAASDRLRWRSGIKQNIRLEQRFPEKLC